MMISFDQLIIDILENSLFHANSILVNHLQSMYNGPFLLDSVDKKHEKEQVRRGFK